MDNEKKEFPKSGDEVDLCSTYYRSIAKVRPHVAKKVKRKMNKRLRKRKKEELKIQSQKFWDEVGIKHLLLGQ